MFSYEFLILIVLIILPIFSSLCFTIFFYKRNRRGRRSPLTGNLLRGAGETLRTEIERFSERIDGAFFAILTMCLPPLALVLVLSFLQNYKVPVWQLILTFVFYCVLVFYATRRLYLLFKQRGNLYLGLDAELAVGQELNQLMLNGCRVYHDFPAENFNIDHVVVGPGGVYAVETKGRAKPDKGRGTADAKVEYDGAKLKFPDWYEVKPLEQAKRQAEWLSRWLSSAVGSPVSVAPALALPGWYVERTASGGVTVFNGKNPVFLARPNGRRNLGEQQIQQIAHQVEQCCRDIEPTAYRKEAR